MAGLEKLDQTLADTVGQISQFIQAHGEEGIGLLGTVYQMTAISKLVQIIPAANSTQYSHLLGITMDKNSHINS